MIRFKIAAVYISKDHIQAINLFILVVVSMVSKWQQHKPKLRIFLLTMLCLSSVFKVPKLKTFLSFGKQLQVPN